MKEIWEEEKRKVNNLDLSVHYANWSSKKIKKGRVKIKQTLEFRGKWINHNKSKWQIWIWVVSCLLWFIVHSLSNYSCICESFKFLQVKTMEYKIQVIFSNLNYGSNFMAKNLWHPKNFKFRFLFGEKAPIMNYVTFSIKFWWMLFILTNLW